MINLSLGFVYVLVAAATYCYLIGRNRGTKSIDGKKLFFALTWPLQAFVSYSKMLKNWDDGYGPDQEPEEHTSSRGRRRNG